MSPKKVRLVIDVVRKMPVNTALDQLRFMNKLAATPVANLVKAAIANAVNTYSLDRDNLFIKEIRSDEGVKLKRWMPKAHGRATEIKKRGCHLNITLAEIKDSGKKEKKVVKASEPVKLEKLAKDSEKTKKLVPKSSKKPAAAEKEVEKEIVDPRMEGRHGHSKIEGGSSKGFTSKVFRRKSG